MKKGKQILMVTMLAGSLGLVACKKKSAAYYTNKTWTTALGDDWSPFSWETSADSSMMSYLYEPFIDLAPLNTEKLSWQWVYRAAKSVTDVTEDHVADLDRYGVDYEEDDLKGYVFQIKLNTAVKFEEKTVNGKKYGGYTVKADDYIESAKLMLSSEYRNYRANTYYSGESAIANAKLYYDSGYRGQVTATNVYDDYSEDLDSVLKFWADPSKEGSNYFVDWFLANYPSYASYLTDGGLGGLLADLFGYEGDPDAINALHGKTLAEIKANADDSALLSEFIAWYENAPGWTGDPVITLCSTEATLPEYNWDGEEGVGGVGLYKVDDETLIYVLAGQSDLDNFKTSLTSNWLVETSLYKDLSYVDETTGRKVSKYNSDLASTISYGPYKMTSFEEKKQVKYAQNDNWWGWDHKVADGKYAATTDNLGYKVNGAAQTIYQTTHIVIDVMEQSTAKQKFEKGELNDYTPTADELLNEYNLSSQLYQVDETYTMRLFFDTNLADLQKMDTAGTNTNGVVLNNVNFRKAFSLAIDRAEWVKTTEGYKPAYSLLNKLYYYDVFNDPTSIYRNTDEAMTAIVNHYGVEWGEGKEYPTLKAAYDSINGYNLDEAKALMATACEELVAAGLYTAGQPIHFDLAWKKGAIEASDNTQVASLETFLNAAREGSGFGAITLTAVGDLADRYKEVGVNGNYAIGYGAWGGAAFYPFTGFRVYMDPDYQGYLHSGRSWNPKTEQLTLEVAGEPVTMTWQAWSNFAATGGAYVSEPNSIKLAILAALEEKYLDKYFDIPLAGSTSCFLMGYQQDYFADEYNIMYDFGGFILLKYNYDDAAWDSFVKSQGGHLNYK